MPAHGLPCASLTRSSGGPRRVEACFIATVNTIHVSPALRGARRPSVIASLSASRIASASSAVTSPIGFVPMCGSIHLCQRENESLTLDGGSVFRRYVMKR